MPPATQQDDDGVDHRADDLVLDLLRLLHELREAGEHDVEHAADLAGLHHVHVQPVEDLGVLGHGLRKGAARLDGLGQLVHGAFEPGVLLLSLDDLQAAQQGQPRVDQRGELARHDHELLRLDPAAAEQDGNMDLLLQAALGGPLRPAAARPGGRLGLARLAGAGLDDLGGEHALFADAPDRGVLVLGLDGAAHLLALRIQRGIGKRRHVSTLLSSFRPRGAPGGPPSPGSRILQHFFHRRVAVEDAADAVLAQGAHAHLDRLVADHQGRLALVDQVADGVGDAQVLEDAAAARGSRSRCTARSRRRSRTAGRRRPPGSRPSCWSDVRRPAGTPSCSAGRWCAPGAGRAPPPGSRRSGTAPPPCRSGG